MELTKFSMWMKNNGRTCVWIAKQLEISRQYLWKIVKGKERASEELAKKIEKFTNSEISSKYIRGDEKKESRCPHCNQKIKKNKKNPLPL